MNGGAVNGSGAINGGPVNGSGAFNSAATRVAPAPGSVDKPSRRNPRPPAGAPAPARPPAADLEVTTQHPPVPSGPPATPQPAPQPKTSVVSRLDPEAAQAARPSAEETAIVAPAPDGYEQLDGYDDLDAFEEVDDEFDGEEDEREERNNDVQQIDATLARFSAVHDEIAAEEEKRRGKFPWRRKEPELGTDMPFDFHEGRDGASRVEWKKKQRKKRTNTIVMVIAVIASLTVFLGLGLFLA